MDNDDWYVSRLVKRPKKEGDHRSEYEKDRCKVIHSYPFRRLQGKIQVVSGMESDFHRNRLTHSIEVASIAKNIYCNIKERRKVKSNDEPIRVFLEQQDKKDIENLLFTIGLLHDIGHPPLGHGGEYALNYKMYKFGGFEGNAQTLRLITTISPLNLTYRTLLGTLKYPINYNKLVNDKAYPPQYDRRISDTNHFSKYLIKDKDWAPPKCYYDSDENIVSDLLQYLNKSDAERFQTPLDVANRHNQSIYKTFDCSIMDIADDISYSIHDLEDAIFFNQINKEDLEEFFSNQNFISKSDWKEYPKQLISKDLDQRKEIISALVHKAIIGTNIFIRTDFSEPLLKYYVDFENDLLKDFIKKLKIITQRQLIETQHVKSIIHGGKVVIMQLFDAFCINPDLLPSIEYEKFKKNDDDNAKCMRVISDYISGMTDQYLFKMHQRIFGANNQNTFDII